MKTRRLVGILCALGLSLGAARCDCNGGSDDAGGADSARYDAGRHDTSSPDLTGRDLVGMDLAVFDAGPGQDVVVSTDAAGTDAAGTDATGTDAATGDGGTGNDGGGQVTVTEACSGAPTTTATAGSCEVQNASGTGLLLVGTVLTPGHVYEPGGVLLNASGTITCAGCDCFTQGASARKVVCNGAVITPGLINTHDHIGWMGDSPHPNMPNASVRYEHRHDWRTGDSADGEGKITTNGGATNDMKAWGELRFILGGATSVNGSGTAPGLMRNLDKASGLEGLSASPVFYSTFPLGDSNGTTLSSGCGYPSFDSETTVAAANAYTPHVSEGINAYARNEEQCLTSTANGGHDLLNANAAIIHGIGLKASDVESLIGDGVKLIWSPRSNVTLYGETAQVTLWHRLGGIVGLGTDWIPSGSMSMLRELACAEYLNRVHFGSYFSFEQLWRMVTYDAARSLGLGDKLGLLAASHVGDIAIFRDFANDPFESVVKAEVDDMLLVLRGGQVLAGRSSVVASLEANCDEIDVCGVNQRVCLQREVSKTYAQLQTAANARYPLFFCSDPDAEPSCVPYRGSSESEAGSSTYDQGPVAGVDDDGDGIANSQDNCPHVFNPIRPIDSQAQGDVDTDGVGDVCDPCPFDANTSACSPFNPDDLDRDGVNDLVDNCPGVPNPAPQVDSDSDGKGDACDLCPNAANPGTAGCPVTVVELQTDTVPVGSRVRVSCAVSGIGSKGFFCQTRAGGPNSGLYVFTNAPPEVESRALAEGDDVDVDGTYTDYYGMCELTAPTLSFVANGGAVQPFTAPAADLATGGSLAESYEGVLVRVTGVSVTDFNADDSPDGSNTPDYDEFALTDGLRVDDLLYDALDNTFAVGTNFSAVVGPLFYSFSNTKILPRRDSDLQTGPPKLRSFSAGSVYQRITGAPATTLPEALYVEMTRAVESDTAITLAALPAGLIEVPAQVTIPTGSDRVEVQVRGLAASSTAAHLTASLDTDSAQTDVIVLADDAPAQVVALEPGQTTLPVDGSGDFTVYLDLPAPTGGSVVDLAVVPDDVVSPGTVAASVTVPFNAMSSLFTFHAGAEPASGWVTASLGAASAVTAHITVIDPTTLSLDLTDWRLNQANSTQSFTLPSGTWIHVNGYVIIARNSTKTDFETFWGVTLGDDVTYVDSGGAIPQINGGETFTLLDSGSIPVVDGPSVALAATGKCHQRKVPVQAASGSDSWTVVAEASGNPGSGQTPGASPSGVYISEFCDATGTGNFNYEFVELYFDGTP
ncbi:MAG: amidohydrolase family protein [Pseudomonadota bacterium]